MNPCTCGTPFRDYDDRCLRCKKQIDPKRAEKLPYHRQVTEIKPCKCSEEIQKELGTRSTSVTELELCNKCDLRVGGPDIEEPDVTKAREEELRRDSQAKALVARRTAEVQRIKSEAKSGNVIYLYKSIYMSIDSISAVAGDQSTLAVFSDKQVKEAGAQGWRVVEAIPRTMGEALQNYEGFGKAWAGGIGGSVIGAYVLMEFTVTSANADSSEVWIRESVEDYII